MLNKSYAYWKMSYQQTEVNSLASECFEMQFSDTDAIKLDNVMSILNSEGEQLKPYNVTIKNICDNDIKYQVNIETLENEDKLADKYITAKVNYEENKVLTSYDSTEGIIPDHSKAYKVYEGHLKKDQVMSIDVRMWMGEEVELYETVDGEKIDKSNEIMNKEFQSKVTIEAEVENQTGEYKEEILNGTDPVIKGDLIPVIIGENGKVTRADTNKKWYNYANSEWANAVILTDTAKDPGAGKEISEDDIESYFVWIPKYSYQIWDLGLYEGLTSIDESKVHTIPIKFGTEDTKDSVKGECTTPMTEDKKQGKSGASDNCQVGEFMTHPAFISFNVNGLWVGKFETGYNQNDDGSVKVTDNWNTTGAQQDIVDSSKIIIKPNVYSWRSVTLANAFQNSYQYQKETLDSHMMKNTEWGAIAYLSHSKYGKYTVKDGNTEIRINNSKTLVTGASAKNEPNTGVPLYNDFSEELKPGQINDDKTYTYLQSESQSASTTGNYTGIYDMSGSLWEFVMAVIINDDNYLFGSSGFNREDFNLESKYFDLYNIEKYDDQAFYKKSILGDATTEVGPFNNVKYSNDNRRIGSWYKDEAWLVTGNLNSNVLTGRGGEYQVGNGCGLFNFGLSSGAINENNGFRIVLAPKS